jgi:hypothetical protein
MKSLVSREKSSEVANSVLKDIPMQRALGRQFCRYCPGKYQTPSDSCHPPHPILYMYATQIEDTEKKQ